MYPLVSVLWNKLRFESSDSMGFRSLRYSDTFASIVVLIAKFINLSISGRALRRANPANYSAVLRGSWVTFVLCFVLLASAQLMPETNHASLRAAVVPVIGYVLLLRHATFVMAGTLGGKGLGSDFTGRWATLFNIGTLLFSMSFRFPPPIKLVMSAVLTVYWTKYVLPKVSPTVPELIISAVLQTIVLGLSLLIDTAFTTGSPRGGQEGVGCLLRRRMAAGFLRVAIWLGLETAAPPTPRSVSDRVAARVASGAGVYTRSLRRGPLIRRGLLLGRARSAGSMEGEAQPQPPMGLGVEGGEGAAARRGAEPVRVESERAGRESESEVDVKGREVGMVESDDGGFETDADVEWDAERSKGVAALDLQRRKGTAGRELKVGQGGGGDAGQKARSRLPSTPLGPAAGGGRPARRPFTPSSAPPGPGTTPLCMPPDGDLSEAESDSSAEYQALSTAQLVSWAVTRDLHDPGLVNMAVLTKAEGLYPSEPSSGRSSDHDSDTWGEVEGVEGHVRRRPARDKGKPIRPLVEIMALRGCVLLLKVCHTLVDDPGAPRLPQATPDPGPTPISRDSIEAAAPPASWQQGQLSQAQQPAMAPMAPMAATEVTLACKVLTAPCLPRGSPAVIILEVQHGGYVSLEEFERDWTPLVFLGPSPGVRLSPSSVTWGLPDLAPGPSSSKPASVLLSFNVDIPGASLLASDKEPDIGGVLYLGVEREGHDETGSGLGPGPSSSAAGAAVSVAAVSAVASVPVLPPEVALEVLAQKPGTAAALSADLGALVASTLSPACGGDGLQCLLQERLAKYAAKRSGLVAVSRFATVDVYLVSSASAAKAAKADRGAALGRARRARAGAGVVAPSTPSAQSEGLANSMPQTAEEGRAFGSVSGVSVSVPTSGSVHEAHLSAPSIAVKMQAQEEKARASTTVTGNMVPLEELGGGEAGPGAAIKLMGPYAGATGAAATSDLRVDASEGSGSVQPSLPSIPVVVAHCTLKELPVGREPALEAQAGLATSLAPSTAAAQGPAVRGEEADTFHPAPSASAARRRHTAGSGHAASGVQTTSAGPSGASSPHRRPRRSVAPALALAPQPDAPGPGPVPSERVIGPEDFGEYDSDVDHSHDRDHVTIHPIWLTFGRRDLEVSFLRSWSVHRRPIELGAGLLYLFLAYRRSRQIHGRLGDVAHPLLHVPQLIHAFLLAVRPNLLSYKVPTLAGIPLHIPLLLLMHVGNQTGHAIAHAQAMCPLIGTRIHGFLRLFAEHTTWALGIAFMSSIYQVPFPIAPLFHLWDIAWLVAVYMGLLGGHCAARGPFVWGAVSSAVGSLTALGIAYFQQKNFRQGLLREWEASGGKGKGGVMRGHAAVERGL